MVRSLLQSILVHLLRNASARLRMSAESAESAIDVSRLDTGRFEIAVPDSGTGMDWADFGCSASLVNYMDV
jgi:hypothetical protein